MLISEFLNFDVSFLVYGITPLHYACKEGQVDMARMLVSEFQANVNIKVYYKWQTPLHYACREGHTNVIKILISEFQANVNSKDRDGQTPLHYACNEGQTDVVRMLLSEFQANVNCIDIEEQTPLHCACNRWHNDVIRILVSEFQANINCTDIRGQTPLHYACIKGNTDVVRMLISEFQANLNSTDIRGQSPLHYACSQGDCKQDVVLLLINECSFDINTKGEYGRTLLHIACSTGQADIVKTCISNHASPLVVDDDGNTPLHISAAFANYYCVEALLEVNTPIMVRNNNGKTPIDLATPSTRQQFDVYIQRHKDKIHAYYDNIKKKAKKKFYGAEPITRIFVVGNPGAGKSSLVETLKRDSFLGSFKQVSESSVPPHTAGIVPSIHTSKHYGRVLFYDFAGDPEYYSSHAAILESLASSRKGDNIFIIVVDMREDNAKIGSLLNYWASFINYQKFKGKKPAFIIVGSHSDNMAASDISAKKGLLKQISTKFRLNSSHQIPTFCFDCHNPRHVHDLQKHITTIAKESPRYKLSLEASMLLGMLEVDFSNVTACSLETLVSHIKDTGISLPTQAQHLNSVLLELHDIGLLFVIQGKTIILNISKLTNIVHQSLFSKTSFSEEINNKFSSFNIGLIPESILQQVLPEYITKECLVQLQYCQQISHKDVGVFPSLTSSDSTDQSFLFFPALSKANKSDVAWVTPSGLSYSIGWLAECTDPTDHFPPRFLHVLLLRLVVRFTLRVPTSSNTPAEHTFFQHRCTMWKTGVHWLMNEGVECMVELVDTSKKVVVTVKCTEEVADTSCLSIFNKVISCIMEAKDDFCHAIRPSFFLLDSTNDLTEDNRFAMSDVQEALTSTNEEQKVILSVNGRRQMKLSKVLCLQNLTYWHYLFSVDFSTVYSCLKKMTNFIELGIYLNITHFNLESIQAKFPQDVVRQRMELVKMWLSSSDHLPCWWYLVEALKRIDMRGLANELEREHGVAIQLQEKLLKKELCMVKPDARFLELFAGVMRNKWPSLAVSLSLSEQEIEEVKEGEEGDQALQMLRKWVSREDATYGQLCQMLKSISLFQY